MRSNRRRRNDVGSPVWTYEGIDARTDLAALEGFDVLTRCGRYAGSVTAVVRTGETAFLAIERGNPPLDHDLRAVQSSEVAGVASRDAVVLLKINAEEVDQAPELDAELKPRNSGSPSAVSSEPCARHATPRAALVVSWACPIGTAFLVSLGATLAGDVHVAIIGAISGLAAALLASLLVLVLCGYEPFQMEMVDVEGHSPVATLDHRLTAAAHPVRDSAWRAVDSEGNNERG